MGKIIYLMGKSSSGKDTIYQRLLASGLKLERLVPYTTRPIRAGETEGVEYHFTDDAGLAAIRSAGKLVELREYHTCHGIWRYFTAVDDSMNLAENNYILIGTIEAYRRMTDYFGQEALLPVLIELDDGVRLQRALDRERQQDHPKYEEMCRRFLADSADFSEEKIAEAGIGRRFQNNDLDQCLEEITAYIIQNTR